MKPFFHFNDLVNTLQPVCYLSGKAPVLKSMLGLTAQAVLERLQRMEECVSGRMMREAPVAPVYALNSQRCMTHYTTQRGQKQENYF